MRPPQGTTKKEPVRDLRTGSFTRLRVDGTDPGTRRLSLYLQGVALCVDLSGEPVEAVQFGTDLRRTHVEAGEFDGPFTAGHLVGELTGLLVGQRIEHRR